MVENRGWLAFPNFTRLWFWIKKSLMHLTELYNMELGLISFIFWTITVVDVCFFFEASLLISLINSESQQRAETPSVDFGLRETWLQALILPLINSVILNLFSYLPRISTFSSLKWENGTCLMGLSWGKILDVCKAFSKTSGA